MYSQRCHGNTTSLQNDADLFCPVCVSNKHKYVCRSIIRKTVEVWPRAHTSGQLLTLVKAIWMFSDREENLRWQRETLQRCKSSEKPESKAQVGAFGAELPKIRGKDPPWRFPPQQLGTFTPQISSKNPFLPSGNAKSFKLARHPRCFSPRSRKIPGKTVKKKKQAWHCEKGAQPWIWPFGCARSLFFTVFAQTRI